MDLNNFKQKLFNKGREYGLQDMELFNNSSKSFDLRVFEQEIDHYAINEDEGISFRAVFDDKIGYAYTEKLDQDSIDFLLKDVKQNANIIDKKEEKIYNGSNNYRKLNKYAPALNNIESKDKIELVKSLEQAAFDKDDRVTAVNHCVYSDLEFKNSITNSKGLDLSFKNNIAYLYISVVAKDSGDVKTAFKFDLTQDFNEFDPKQLAGEAVEEAVSLFGAESLPSDKYPVILRHDVAAKMLSTFSSTLSAEKVQKGMSLFKGKLGEKVASKKVTIVDDPFLDKGFCSTPFDGEGVATYKKNIVDNGNLTTYLHNLKTADKAETKSTGNAYRGSHKSYIDIAPTNMYLKPGMKSYQELIKSIDKGVIIINVQGLHAGANPVSGDFSLSASGYVIENGAIARPVEQITIAGNFIDLLKDIEELGRDLRMNLPGSSHIGAPSLKIKALDIAGE